MRKTTALVCILLTPALAAADGRLEGRVERANADTYLSGALVKLPSLGLETSTRPDGRFTFSSLPSGETEIVVDYLGFQTAAQSVIVQDDRVTRTNVALSERIDEVIVYGQAGSAAAALNQQKSADGISSIVSSDEFGQLPDANLSEALQRIPGVFVERDQGEGRYVGIRGIDPNLNITSINGVVVPSPENATRAVALDVIPADLTETLEVRKSLTPDMEPAGIGGSINVRSLSAFDRKGSFLNLRAEGSYNELEDQLSPKLALSYSNRFLFPGSDDEFGVALALSWFDRSFGSDNIETDGGWPSDLELDSGAEFTGAEEIEQRDFLISRDRVGIAANFDYRPSDESDLFLRVLFSEFTDHELRTREEFKLDKGDALSGTSVSATWQDARMDRELKDRLEIQEIYSVVAGGNHRLDRWIVNYAVGYSKSQELEPNRVDSEFRIDDVELGYTGVGETPNLFADPQTLDPNAYELSEITIENNSTIDDKHTIRLDLAREIDADRYSGYFKFGINATRRDKLNDQNIAIYDGFPGDPTLLPFVADSPDYGLGTFGPGISTSAMRAFVVTNRNAFEQDDDETLASSLGGDYQITEDTDAAYIMSRIDFDKARAVFGVRYETTDFAAEGQRVLIDDVNGTGSPTPQRVSFSDDYGFLLPSVNLRFSLNEDLILRAAWYESFGRPAFAELSPGGQVEFEEDDGETELKAKLGNPLLRPLEASNLDLSIEYYDQGIGLLSAGMFYKRVKNFVALADVSESADLGQFVGGVAVDDAEIIQPINGDKATLFGVEVSWIKRFDEMAAPWNGLLLSANATFTDSEAQLPARAEKINLPRQSETVTNFILGYETARFSSRLAASYKSDALLLLGELDDPAFDVFRDQHLQIDFSLKYDVSERWQVYLEGKNLTNEPFFSYYGSPHLNAKYERYGPTFGLGFQFRAR